MEEELEAKAGVGNTSEKIIKLPWKGTTVWIRTELGVYGKMDGF